MLKLVRREDNSFDVQEDADGSGAVATLIYALLLTNKAVADPDVGYDGRGWWANPQAGSELWHVRRGVLNGAAKQRTIEVIQNTLSREPTLSNIVVTEVPWTGAGGSVSLLAVDIKGEHNGKAFNLGFSI